MLGVTQERTLVIERVRGQRYYTSRFEKPPKLSLSGPVCESANGSLERARGEGGRVSLQVGGGGGGSTLTPSFRGGVRSTVMIREVNLDRCTPSRTTLVLYSRIFYS